MLNLFQERYSLKEPIQIKISRLFILQLRKLVDAPAQMQFLIQLIIILQQRKNM
jgi:hypothetical protein